MAFIQNHNQCFFILLVLFSCTAKQIIKDNLTLCQNNTVSCTSRFLTNTGASDRDCTIVAYRGAECSNRKFVTSASSCPLGKMRMRTYPFYQSESHPALNISLTDIKWTVFRFRFKLMGDNITFCREFHRTATYPVKEIFYDCLSTPGAMPGRSFIFEYQAEDDNNNVETRKFINKIPLYRGIEKDAPLENYTPFLYVDITDSPEITVRWQQAPFSGLKYRVEIYKTDEDSAKTLEHSAVVDGKDGNDEELNYKYNIFPSSGRFHVELRVLNKSCINGLCNVSISPLFEIDSVFTRTLLVGVVGCVVLIPLFLFIAFMWRRQCQPPRMAVKLPVVLIIHTPSRASHLRSVIALTEYLKNHCFIEALLDQLDVQFTETKDPWKWCNNAFARADFVMVVSSPPKCCNEEGIFRNMDLVALRFLKEKFSSGSSKPRFFSVMLPYCTKEDIPEEARNLRIFKLMRDFDQMLWYIHNGGKLPSVLSSAHMLVGPSPHGGKSDLNMKGKVLLTALKEAEFDRGKVCNCANKKVKENENDEDETTGFIKLLNPPKIDYKIDSQKEGHLRNLSESGSTSELLRMSESSDSSNYFGERNIEFPDSSVFPHVTELDLLQDHEVPPVTVVDRENVVKQSGFSVHGLSL